MSTFTPMCIEVKILESKSRFCLLFQIDTQISKPPRTTFRSPGYAITLLSSSTSHVLHSSESSSCRPSTSSTESESTTPQTPEDLGIEAARQLLSEIRRGGCVDRGWEWLVTTMLVLGGEDVGKVKVGGAMEAFLYVSPILFLTHSLSLIVD